MEEEKNDLTGHIRRLDEELRKLNGRINAETSSDEMEYIVRNIRRIYQEKIDALKSIKRIDGLLSELAESERQGILRSDESPSARTESCGMCVDNKPLHYIPFITEYEEKMKFFEPTKPHFPC